MSASVGFGIQQTSLLHLLLSEFNRGRAFNNGEESFVPKYATH
jgi:hypothetical protein